MTRELLRGGKEEKIKVMESSKYFSPPHTDLDSRSQIPSCDRCAGQPDTETETAANKQKCPPWMTSGHVTVATQKK